MKRLIFSLLSLLVGQYLFAQVPVSDDSKYYQLKSMEVGPWKFQPEWWYYTWYEETFLGIPITLPGLGIHDNGFLGTGFPGDQYVTRYGPSAPLRARMLAKFSIAKSMYEKTRKAIKEIHDREVIDMADREVDIAFSPFKKKFLSLDLLFTIRISEYIKNGGKAEDVVELQTARGKILESLKLIKKSYVTNAKRQKAYAEELAQFEKLCRILKKSTLFLIKYNKLKTLGYGNS